MGGWVGNRLDGSVEILTRGDPDVIDELIAACREGPRAARVERVEVAESGEAGPLGFEINPTV